jgi:hypothetical protein
MTAPPRFVAVVVLATLAACATQLTQRTVLREVENASVSSTTALDNVAVVAIGRDAALRKGWEDAFASRLAARGVATSTGDGVRASAGVDADAVTVDGGQVIEAARKAGAGAILFIQPPGAVLVAEGRGAYRWLDARSSPDPRSELDTTPASVTEVRLYDLRTGKSTWRAMVVQYYPKPRDADAGEIADSVVAGLAKRGWVRTAAR